MKRLIFSSDNLFGDKKVIGITNGNLTLSICPNDEADKVIKKFHYSHKTTKNRFLSFAVNDGKGYLQLGYGIRPMIKDSISKYIKKGNYCEFDRMWLCDELPKNSESQVIALLLSFIKQTMPAIKFVITYADESVGNFGTIYKASNAFYLGFVYVDFYQLENGERVHPVSMWHRHKTRKWATLQKLYPNIKHICRATNKQKQHRFLYILNKHFASQVLRETRLLTK
ncbi:MAG: hypothetical protein R3Y43_04160 [Alphaproteobacteria bacterium]